MDSFPKDFNRKYCENILHENQYELMKQTRLDIYEKIITAMEQCRKHIHYNLPEMLSNQYKEQLVLELLERFDSFDVTTVSGFGSTTTKLTKGNNVPIIRSFDLAFN